jgi:DNA-binding CsgD family transcriptional regulator
MARAVLKAKVSTWKEQPSTAGGILERGGSRAESTALVSENTERWSVQAGQSLAPKPTILRPFATTEGRLVAALDKALEAIAPPAFVLTCDGEILRANAPARQLLAQEGEAVGQSLARAISHGATETTWDLAPLGNEGDPAGFLAICRPPSRAKSIVQALPKARRSWKLTTRQIEVLDLVARGLTNDLIAEELMIGKGTVEFHLSAIFDKAGVSNRAMLIIQMLDLNE